MRRFAPESLSRAAAGGRHVETQQVRWQRTLPAEQHDLVLATLSLTRPATPPSLRRVGVPLARRSEDPRHWGLDDALRGRLPLPERADKGEVQGAATAGLISALYTPPHVVAAALAAAHERSEQRARELQEVSAKEAADVAAAAVAAELKAAADAEAAKVATAAVIASATAASAAADAFVYTEQPIAVRIERQLALERRAADTAMRSAISVHESMREIHLLAEAVMYDKLERQWNDALQLAITSEQERCVANLPGLDRAVYAPYLILLDPETLSQVTIREALAASLGPEQGVSTLRLALSIGSVVEKLVAASVNGTSLRRMDANSLRVPSSPLSAAAKRFQQSAPERRQKVGGVDLALSQSAAMEWPSVVRVKVGALLLELLRRCALVHVDPTTLRFAEEEGPFATAPATTDQSKLVFPPVRERVTPLPGVVLKESSPEALAAVRAAQGEGLPVGLSDRDALNKGKVGLSRHDTAHLHVMNNSPVSSATLDTSPSGDHRPSSTLTQEEEAAASAVSAAEWDAFAEFEDIDTLLDSSAAAAAGSYSAGSHGGWGGEGGAQDGGAAHELLRSHSGSHDMSSSSGGRLSASLSGLARASTVGEAVSALRREIGGAMQDPFVASFVEEDAGASPAIAASVPWSDLGLRGSIELSPGRVQELLTATNDSSGASHLPEAQFRDILRQQRAHQRLRLVTQNAKAEAKRVREDVSRSSVQGPEAAAAAAAGAAARMDTVAASMPPASGDAAVITLAQSLAARVTARTPHREVTLRDGRVVWAVPAFLHHYIYTTSSSSRSKGTLTPNAFERHRARFTGLIFAHPRLSELLSVRTALLSAIVPAPMVVPPAPWTAFWGPGPYLTARFPFMRTVAAHRTIVAAAMSESSGEKRAREAAAAEARQRQQQSAPVGVTAGPSGSGLVPISTLPLPQRPLGAVIEGLDVLSATPWRINGSVLSTVRAVWNDAGDPEGRGGRAPVAGLPKVPEMPPFESQDPLIPGPFVPTPEQSASSVTLADAKYAYAKESARKLQRRAEAHSLRSDFRLKLEVAKDHAHDASIYFPHNMDFRGRVYPMPPHLNHMGNDLSRGLLTFRDARPLGATGQFWLSVHLANLMGADKLPFEARAAFVDAHVADVLASAEAPLVGGSRGEWWTTSEKPWQALATCRELAAVLRLPAHARPLYESRLPVHQDGSCNGLQHYAALSRDEEGARAVNLVPRSGDEPDTGPSDVYTQVLAIVLKHIESDVSLSCEPAPISKTRERALADSSVFAQARASRMSEDTALQAETAPMRKLAALFLRGRVDRKVVKQTVMTSVYGVTFLGAREQVWNRLRERCTPGNAPATIIGADNADAHDYVLQASSAYLARLTLNSLGSLFSSADAIKGWLADAARAIAARDQPVAWVTPLGLPCVQPYRENERKTVVTVLQNVVMRDTGDPALPVSRARQKSAFPPNFIHSLDSSHMFYTALACKREGITFAAVHDSFWTHPGSVERMRDLLRAEFVGLYAQPILEDFRDSVLARTPGLVLPDLPPRGTLDLREVLQSRYFFG